MAKKKAEDKISKNEQQLLDGLDIIRRHPLFGKLSNSPNIVGKAALGKSAARTSARGKFLNKDVDLSPSEWAYVIAHCMLHLAFGHFDAERMPGFWDESGFDNSRVRRDKQPDEKKWIVSCDFSLWNMACDIYISKFLADIKFGTSIVDVSLLERYGGAASEVKIYDRLVREHVNASENRFGVSGVGFCDMIEPDRPLVYHNGANNRYVSEFAYALADSVRTVINTAGGITAESAKPLTLPRQAAQWFVNHYPLLGGIAAGFKVIDTRDPDGLRINDVEIAAVNVVDGEIYVNRAAGLNYEEWKFVLAHEYLHAGLQHHARREGRDHYLWNVACDFVINGWLHEMQIGVMPSHGLLYDEKLKGMSAEEIYDELIKNLRQNSKLGTFRGYGKGDIIDEGHTARLDEPTSLDEFCKNALRSGLEYHTSNDRGFIPAGLVEEIKALSVPPIPWDVELAQWFEVYFAPLEKKRSYARPSRRQSSTPDIPRPSLLPADIPENSRTYGVIIDTSGSMPPKLLGMALGAAASYSVAKDVPLVRVVFCDADAYDIGYVTPEDIAGRVEVKGRGGTVIQPAVDLLESADDFPKNAPILIITDGYIENDLQIKRDHAFLIPRGNRLPFRARGKVFYFE